jgi:hypothetical protein
MSVLDFPRVNFWGTQRVNPGTGNNNSLGPGQGLTVTSNTEQVQPVDSPLSDDDFVTWMEGADSMGLVRGQWNYYGDMSMRFDDVVVNSGVIWPGQLITEDPLIGAKVSLINSLVCDVDPEGFDCTQIFSNALQIDAPGALGGTGVFVSRRPTRAVTRSLNWYRNVSFHGVLGDDTSGGAGGASATFIHAVKVLDGDLEPIPDRGAEYDEVLHHWWPKCGADGAPTSRLVNAMHDALRRNDVIGLQIRYNLYLCYPRIADSALVKQFAAGRRTENPAVGLVLGTIAPWHRGEPESMTLARTLKPAQSYVNAYRSDGKPYYLAPAIARIDENTGHVSIDLANTLPEDGADGEKYALGKVTLGVRRATQLGAEPAANTSPVVCVGEIKNDRDSFVARGGIYDLEINGDAVPLLADPDHEIVLSTERYGVLLYEPEYTIGSDCEAVYLDEAPPQAQERVIRPSPQRGQGEQPLPQELLGSVPLHVRRRGRIPDKSVSLVVEQWRFTPSGDPKAFGAYLYPRKLGSRPLEVRGGLVEHELHPLDGPGVLMFRYVVPRQWQQDMDGANLAKLAFQEDYTFLRILPHDAEAAAAAASNEPIDYATIYKHVLRYYALILPAMSKRLEMSANSAELWTSPTAARYLLRTTSPDLWNHWAYMPRTRDLSKTRRDLLRRFCLQIIDAAAGSAAEGDAHV